ncbi:MAG TPA: chromophore lyase CpcT/CpeT [Xenococcaceae cyanobacterium]
MNFSLPITTLAQYLVGEFDNQAQALEQPAWFVHLRLWQRRVPLFTEDSITLFAEQASVINLEQPYRPRILRLRDRGAIEIEYYMFKDIAQVIGAGRNPTILEQISATDIEFLPNCTLKVAIELISPANYRFTTSPVTETPCSFNYQDNNYQVFLGLEVTKSELKTYDKGIDPMTGKGIWGALIGAYRFNKLQSFN